jgi:superfamily II DNA or RNA helicase
MTLGPPLPSLSRSVASHFDDKSRIRGQSYFVQGRVHIKDASAEHAIAQVRGTHVYRVEMKLANRELVAECGCPLAGTCKHMWATLLAAERQGSLGRIRSAPPASLRVVKPPSPPRPLALVPRASDPVVPSAKDLLPGAGAVIGVVPSAAPPKPGWKVFLESVPYRPKSGRSSWQEQELVYVIDTVTEPAAKSLMLRLYERRSSKKEVMGPWRRLDFIPADVRGSDAKRILSLVRGIRRGETSGRYTFYARPSDSESADVTISGEACEVVLSRLAEAGMLARVDSESRLIHLTWDAGPAWRAQLRLIAVEGRYHLALGFRRETPKDFVGPEEELDPDAVVMFSQRALVLRDRVAKLAPLSPECKEILSRRGGIEVPTADVERFIETYYAAPRIARLDLPPDLALTSIEVEPRPRAHLGVPKPGEDIPVEVRFQYLDVQVADDDAREVVLDVPGRRRIARNGAVEAALLRRLSELGVKEKAWGAGFSLSPSRAPKVVRSLLSEGWHVEATGKLYRSATGFGMRVASGVDWFDVDGSADYGGMSVPLPSLLAAVRRGETAVTLDDGTLGLLPEEWLARWKLLGDLGETEGGHLRFKRTQLGILDVILEAEPQIEYDAAFGKLRAELRSSFTAEPREQPPGFQGQLRDYQRAGLGWMDRLARSGFGGCLADDMGLGKTVQVLAWLLARRESGETRVPSLVVAPRSLIFNWKDEATRFAPELSILDYTGAQRVASAAHMEEHDIVLTTYGTLRRDAVELSEIAFDYVILDEAQSIKNAESASFKAARVLQANHRLALTGTPIENHVGELFTLFEFLNPSMLGRAHKKAGKRQLDASALGVVGRALRPFILRRTKQEVVTELPAKTEKTLYCELGAAERRLYDELASHYRDALFGRIAETGMKKAAFHVLEALLRLRQAACHPGLVDKTRASSSSAKIDTLLAELGSVVAEGHKALVFSQFTSLLAIVRERLGEEKIAFEYLDGQTRDRRARVARFQEDETCQVFLISLKAGGLGLNLTAAEYVFILDPWWNPAVEAQAVDRAHRIGQSRPVFAYRIIARGTVEEKVAELQRTKAAMAQAILSAGDDAQASGSVLADLSIEELTSLLS